MKKRNRIISLIMVLLLLATFIPESTHAVSAGQKGTSKAENLGKGTSGYYYYNTRLVKHYVAVSGTKHMGYCLDVLDGFKSGYTYTAKSTSNASDFKNLSSAKQNTLTRVMLYAYWPGKSAPYGNASDYYAATQGIVWDVLHSGLKVDLDTGKWSGGSANSNYLLKGHKNGQKNYDWIKKEVTAHLKGASFTRDSSSKAKTYVMKYNYADKKFSRTLTDTNEGNTYKKSSFTKGLSMSRSKYKYTFSASKAGTYSAVLKNNISTGTSQAMLIFQSPHSTLQSTAYGATDPNKFYVKFETESPGTAKIVKTSDDGNVSGFTFNVKNTANGYNANHTTDVNGVITQKLYPGTYTVTEVLTADQKAKGYVAPPAKTITVKEGKTATVYMHNSRPKGTAKVIKTSDTGVVAGFNFNIRSTDGTYNQTFTTDANGLITAGLYPGTYTITEVLTGAQMEEGYKSAGTVTKTIAANQTVQIPVHNKYEPVENGVRIFKSTSDNGPVEGFRFQITGIHNNSKSITAEDILEIAEPEITGMEDYDVGEWGADEKSEGVIDEMNEAAKDGRTGEYEVKFTAIAELKDDGTEPGKGDGSQPPGEGDQQEPDTGDGDDPDSGDITEGGESGEQEPEEGGEGEGEDPDAGEEGQEKPKPETVEFSITVKVTLEDVTKTTEAGEEQTDETGNVAFKDVTAAISATTYEGEGVTDAIGRIIKEELETGTYTITEALTEVQKLRYEHPQSQTISILEDGATGTVFFENIAKQTHVKIKKSCIDGNIGGIEFTITGKTAWGEEITPIKTVTDKDGNIDLTLYGGTYVIEETGLDPALYIKQPPVVLTLTGEEEETVEVPFANIPYTDTVISKKSSITGDHLAGCTLQILDGETEKVITEWVTDEEPKGISKLAQGKEYILHESYAPEGYGIAEDIRFVAGEKEQIEMVNYPTRLFITKIDDSNGVFLEGAEFEILDAADEGLVCRFTVIEEDGQKKAVISEAIDGITSNSMTEQERTEEEEAEQQEKDEAKELLRNRMLRLSMPSFYAASVKLNGEAPSMGGDDGWFDEADQEEEYIKHYSDEMYGTITGLTEHKEYILREIKAPEGYTTMGDVEFTFTDDMAIEAENDRPSISTQAHDGENGTKISRADRSVTIIDTVDHINLIAGESYTLVATLMQEDGTPLLGTDGQPVTASVEFIPETGSGCIDVTLPAFDGMEMDGRKVTVFEYLYYKDKEVANHADIKSAEQTVTLSEEIGRMTISDDDIELLRRLGIGGYGTGDSSGKVIMACIILLAGSAAAAAVTWRRKNR